MTHKNRDFHDPPDIARACLPATLCVMKLSRLYQPRNPLFWLMVAVNLMSMILGWIAQTYSVGVLVSLMIVVFAIGNVVLGAFLAWRLLNS
jgi:hypothetical protein